MKTSSKILTGAVCAPALLNSAGSLYMLYYASIRQKDKSTARTMAKYPALKAAVEWFWDKNPEKMEILSHDGLRLVGYYLAAEVPTHKTLILMHGYRSAGMLDFAGFYEYYHNLGYNILVPYQRTHGESEGRFITYGYKEKEDVKRWAQYLVERDPDVSIVLHGISMGCATVLMAAALDLPVNVKGIIGDCGYTSAHDIFVSVQKASFHTPEFLIIPTTELLLKRFAGFDAKKTSALEAMKHCRLPVLFVHGKKDDFVPCEMTLANYAACTAPKELLLVEGAAHGTSIYVDPQAYHEKVERFLEKYF